MIFLFSLSNRSVLDTPNICLKDVTLPPRIVCEIVYTTSIFVTCNHGKFQFIVIGIDPRYGHPSDSGQLRGQPDCATRVNRCRNSRKCRLMHVLTSKDHTGCDWCYRCIADAPPPLWDSDNSVCVRLHQTSLLTSFAQESSNTPHCRRSLDRAHG